MRQKLSAWITGILVSLSVGCSGTADIATRMSSVRIDSNTYIVQAGDTIESVAYRYKLTSDELARLNPAMRNSVYPGQPIAIRSGRRNITPTMTTTRRRTRQPTEVPASYRPDPLATPVVVSAVPVREVPIRENTPLVMSTAPQRRVTEEIIEESAISGSLSPRVAAPSNVNANHGGWQWPLAGEVVRAYAPGEVNGQGIDIAGVPGQAIRATAGGTVIYADRDLSDSGNLVIIRHSANVLSTYSHANDLYVAENDTVRAGDTIASLGSNSSRESVLHFGVRKSGKPVDPLGFLPIR